MKASVFAILLIFVSLTSCETEDLNKISYEKEVAGNWQLITEKINGQQQVLSSCDLRQRITFTLNGDFFNNSSKVNDSTLECEAVPEVSGNFSFNTNRITIDISEEESQEGIVIRDQNQLTIRTTEDSKIVERDYKRVESRVNRIIIE